MITIFSFNFCDRKSFFVLLLSFFLCYPLFAERIVTLSYPPTDNIRVQTGYYFLDSGYVIVIASPLEGNTELRPAPEFFFNDSVMTLSPSENGSRQYSCRANVQLQYGLANTFSSITFEIHYPNLDPEGGGSGGGDSGGGDSGGGDSGGGDSGGGDSGGGDSGGGDSGGGSGGAYALESSMQTLITVIRNSSNDYLYRILTTDESIFSKLNSFFTNFNQFTSNVNSYLATINTNVNSSKNTLDSISGKVSTIQADVGTIREKVSTIKDDVSSVKSDISKIENNTLDTKNLLSDIKGKFTGNLPNSPSGVSTINPHSNAWDTIKHKLLPSYNFFRNVGSNNMHFNFIFETTNFGLQSFNVPITFPWDQLPSNFADPDRGSLRTFLTFFRKLLLVLMAWCFLKVVLKTLRQW